MHILVGKEGGMDEARKSTSTWLDIGAYLETLCELPTY
jgi:hypothetical protein